MRSNTPTEFHFNNFISNCNARPVTSKETKFPSTTAMFTVMTNGTNNSNFSTNNCKLKDEANRKSELNQTHNRMKCSYNNLAEGSYNDIYSYDPLVMYNRNQSLYKQKENPSSHQINPFAIKDQGYELKEDKLTQPNPSYFDMKPINKSYSINSRQPILDANKSSFLKASDYDINWGNVSYDKRIVDSNNRSYNTSDYGLQSKLEKKMQSSNSSSFISSYSKFCKDVTTLPVNSDDSKLINPDCFINYYKPLTKDHL